MSPLTSRRARARVPGSTLTSLATALLILLAGLLLGASGAQAQNDTNYVYPKGRSTSFFKPADPIRAKDFSVFKAGSTYHLFYIRVNRDLGDGAVGSERDFGHAVSTDLLNWTELPPINPDGGYTNGVANHPVWDSLHVWAPHVIQIGATYYMFFTGVDGSNNQKIGVSTSTDLYNWTPSAANPVYEVNDVFWTWKPASGQHMRDPFVMRDVASRDGTGVAGWLMYYTSRVNSSTEVVGMAWAPYSDPTDWHNLALGGSHIGQVFTTLGDKAESAHMAYHGGAWYLFYSGPGGLRYIYSYDPTSNYGWWGPYLLPDANNSNIENGFWQNWFASEYVTDGTNEYLMFIHDYDPPGPCDPKWGQLPTPSTIEARIMNWNALGSPGFLTNLAVPPADNAWIQRCRTTAPSARWGASLVYDSANDRMILFGGRSSDSDGSNVESYNDTWVYTPNTLAWAPLTTYGTPPPARSDHVAVYDPVRQQMVVVGGAVGNNAVVHVLSLNGTPTWSAPPASGAPGGFGHMTGTYDSGRDQLVTVDEWNGVLKLNLATLAWGSITPYPPPLGRQGTVTYDATHQHLLYVGGWDIATPVGNCPTPKTTSQWISRLDLTQPSPGWTTVSTAPWNPRYLASAYVDTRNNKLVVFGGIGYAQACRCIGPLCGSVWVPRDLPYEDVWQMDLTSLAWTQRVPQPGTGPGKRGYHAAAYDTKRDEMVVFGGGEFHADDAGVNCSSICNTVDVYTYRGDTWTFRSDVAPPATIALGGFGSCYDHVYLMWTAPGDDGAVGNATAYDLRWSSSSITPANFQYATSLPIDPPFAGGADEIRTIYVPWCSTMRYYAIRTRDHAYNWSAVSNSIGLKPACPTHGYCEEIAARPPVEETPLPTVMELAPPQPNPASLEGMSIAFGIPEERRGADYDVSVYDIVGRRIRAIAHGSAEPGYHRLSWDLRGDDGSPMRGGVFFLRFRLGDETLSRRVIVAR